jgi:hypothetical protein
MSFHQRAHVIGHDLHCYDAHPTSGYLHLPGHAGDYTHDLCQTAQFPRRLKTALPPRGA